MGPHLFHRISQITPSQRGWRGSVSMLLLAAGPLACDAPRDTTPATNNGPEPVESAPPMFAAPLLPTASASAEPTEIERVRQGDIAAMKRLELTAPAERSVEQVLALSEGRAALARTDANRLVEDLKKDAKLRLDAATLAYAAKLALDQAAGPVLLVGLVEIGDPVLLDFVHDLGARGDGSARLPLLAHDLLRVKAARAKASRALALLLELEDAALCWQVANQLARATADGDSRAAPLLDRFKAEKGCGPKKLDDCWPCLREPTNADALQKAIDAAAARKLDAFWLAK